jgi:hypothetical protein
MSRGASSFRKLDCLDELEMGGNYTLMKKCIYECRFQP